MLSFGTLAIRNSSLETKDVTFVLVITVYLIQLFIAITAVVFHGTYDGSIRVSLESNDDKIIFTVKDTGIGILQEKLEKIFEPYYQISNEKRNIQGIGMGLHITKSLVESLGGTIEVESKYGSGSTFKTVFERYMKTGTDNPEEFNDYSIPAEEITVDLGPEEFSKERKTVMLVEDNAQMLSYLFVNLKDKYNVFYAVNGKQALEKINNMTGKPDVIVSDIMMDEMDGHELFEKLKADDSYSYIPFIFLTAVSSFKDKLISLKNGAVDYINKPFSIEELELKISALLDNIDIQKKVFVKKIGEKAINTIKGQIEEIPSSSYKDFEKICGEKCITNREKQILKSLLNGKENKEIADVLNISINTIKVHSQNIYTKLGVNNRIELLNIFYKKE